LIAAGAPGYGQPVVYGPSGSSDQHDQLKAFNDLITSWPSRLVATCLFVALAGLVYVLYKRETSPEREPLRAVIIVLGLFAVPPLLTTNVIVGYVMFMCLAVAWVYVFFRHILPRLGGLPNRAAELVHPERRRESLAARRRSFGRGVRLERTLESALHEREAPRE
jgi:hypothetical protein